MAQESETIKSLRDSAQSRQEIEPEPIPQSEPLTAEEVSDWVDGIGDPEPPAAESEPATLFDNAPPATDAATTDGRKKGGKK